MRIVFRIALVTVLLGAIGCHHDSTSPTSDTQPSAAVASASGAWTTRAPYPRDWSAASSVAVTNPVNGHDILYVIGGAPPLAGPGKISDAVKAYDVETNVWSNRARFPVPVWQTNGAVAINGKIYVSGGQSRRFDETRQGYVRVPLRSLYVYDPSANTWTRRADMPIQAAAQGPSATVNGFLYVATPCNGDPACGSPTDTEQGALWRYNPKNDNWVLLTRTPHDPSFGGGGFIGGKFYLSSEAAHAAVDVYDVATNTWSAGPARPGSTVCDPSYATAQGKLYLTCPVAQHTELLVLNPATGWSLLGPTPNNAGGPIFTMSRVMRGGRTLLELVGGDTPTNNLQFTP